MVETPPGLPPGCPAWLRELDLLRTACSHFLISGNSEDSQLVPGQLIRAGDGLKFVHLENVLTSGLGCMGYDLVVHYDVVNGVHYSRDPDQNEQAASLAKDILGIQPETEAEPGNLNGLAELIGALADTAGAVSLVVHSAARLVLDVNQLTDAEFDFFRRVDRSARNASLVEDRATFNPVIWLVSSDRDLPSWFSVGNHQVRQVAIPLPDPEARRQAARLWIPQLPEAAPDGGDAPSTTVAPDPIATFAAQTSGFTLNQANAIVRLAQDQGLRRDQIDDAVRSYRVGELDNPWRRPYLTEKLATELGDDPTLPKQVIGQDQAVRRAVDILVRSHTGLTGAHASPSATRPRGVLFFAGPTGVGKTELARRLTDLLFDNQEAYIRFDMSEFSAEHSADRLIGAPPGYQGHDVGGELTNTIRERPFSVVLFDEVEKAHPRILDKFLQILDDGRLSDGRGQTVFFTEAVIVFTTNLGVYVEKRDGDRKWRELNVTRDMAPEEMHDTLTTAIRDHFTEGLGRPELLNRIGDNIVVFDFIDEDAGRQIFDLMLNNILGRVQHEHSLDLTVSSDARSWLEQRCLSGATLDLGGRGIGNVLETSFENPLARAIFLRRAELGGAAVCEIREHHGQITAELTAAGS